MNPENGKGIKLAIVSHALAHELSQIRWRLLAEKHNIEVHLLVPKKWKTTWLRDETVFRPQERHEGRFHVHPLPTTSCRKWGRYFFVSIDAKLREIEPDIIYVIQEEMIFVHHQIMAYRRLWCPRAKYIYFTMHALGIPEQKWHQRLRWYPLRDTADAALCHYPGCLESLRKGGFRKPVFMQTQVGVNEDIFKPDPVDRAAVREHFGWQDKFVIGYAGRLTEDKGVLDLVSALPVPDTDWALLLVGNGDQRERIEEIARKNNWESQIKCVGSVDLPQVAKYMRAMDCFVLGSRTTPTWIDTFPLVTVQAMACGVPVIGSDSASLPWQIGEAGLIFPEGNVAELRNAIARLARDGSLQNELAGKGRQRSVANFCIGGLTDRFYDVLQQIHTGSFRSDLPDTDQRKAWLP